jgi:hypothetical protein
MEGRYSLAVVIVLVCYGAVLGAYAGRWALRKTQELEQLRGRVWDLEASAGRPGPPRGILGTEPMRSQAPARRPARKVAV